MVSNLNYPDPITAILTGQVQILIFRLSPLSIFRDKRYSLNAINKNEEK